MKSRRFVLCYEMFLNRDNDAEGKLDRTWKNKNVTIDKRKFNRSRQELESISFPVFPHKIVSEFPSRKQEIIIGREKSKGNDKWIFSFWSREIMIVSFIFLLPVFYSFYRSYQSSANLTSEMSMKNEIAKLEKEFSTQSNETWKIIWGVFTNKENVAKSIFLLHKNNKSTCNNFIDKLVSIYKMNKNFHENAATFENVSEKDYGELLEHYRDLVKKHGVLIIDLNKVSSNMAGMFHFLSDEIHPQGNVPLFIFTLRDEIYISSMKPLTRAEAIVKSVWRELPENEIYPLISRIVKNVILVKPEMMENFANNS